MKALYLSLIIVIVDQVTKLLVKGFAISFLGLNFEGMYLGQMIPVWGDFFRLTFVENPGMAFGYDPGEGFKLIISIFFLIASIGLVIYLYAIRDKSLSLRIAIACILRIELRLVNSNMPALSWQPRDWKGCNLLS